MATATALLTAEEYEQQPDNGVPSELVRGRIVEMNIPAPRHEQICVRIIYLLSRYLEDHPLGHVLSNDSGIVTERGPDTVRGADVAFYSFQRLPPGPIPLGYLSVVPELVFEVRSPTDRWSRIHQKVAEYLAAGVSVVCVLDQTSETAHLFYEEQPGRVLMAAEELTFPEILGDFRVRVSRFFEAPI